MMKHPLIYWLSSIIIACLAGAPVIAQNKLSDSACLLTLVENKAFTAFANSRTKPPVNEISKKVTNEILYLVYTQQTGHYTGTSLLLDDAFNVIKCYRFTYNKQSGFKVSEQGWSGGDLPIKTLFIDSAGYMNQNYMSEGTDEMLLCRKKGVPVTGLIYKGCTPGDPAKEIYVYNKTWMQLLTRLRGNY